jgi:hypothetical protein
MLQVVGAGGVPSPYRTFLEMALQNVTPAEGVFAEMARVRSLTRVSEQMALEMFQVQVGLVTMWALILALGVLGSVGGSLSCRGRGPAGMCW